MILLALGTDFPAAFAGLDALVLTPVYAASEAPLAGGTTLDLYRRFRAAAAGGVPVTIPVLAYKPGRVAPAAVQVIAWRASSWLSGQGIAPSWSSTMRSRATY